MALMSQALTDASPAQPWQEGSHAELLADLNRRGLIPAQAGRWLWDPAPTPLNKGAWHDKREGDAAPCPFLDADLPLLEAHVQWSRTQRGGGTTRLLGLVGCAWRRLSRSTQRGGGTIRLLVLRHRGRLRWRWHEAEPGRPGEERS